MGYDRTLTDAADYLDNDALLPIIRIMRGIFPPRPWREIGRKLRLSHTTVYRLAVRNGIR